MWSPTTCLCGRLGVTLGTSLVDGFRGISLSVLGHGWGDVFRSVFAVVLEMSSGMTLGCSWKVSWGMSLGDIYIYILIKYIYIYIYTYLG